MRFDPELVSGQLNSLLEEQLLSDDDYLSNTSGEDVLWVWLLIECDCRRTRGGGAVSGDGTNGPRVGQYCNG